AQGRAVEHRETVRVRRDGAPVDVSLTISPIRDSRGEITGVSAISRDLSTRKRAERALRASQARFTRLAESGIVGIAFADVDGALHDTNDAWLHMFGYSREDLATKKLSWTAMVPPEHRDASSRAREELRRRGVASPWEQELCAKDGRRVPVLIGVAMLEYPDCIAVLVDLSERKRAERALRQTEDQLRQAQKMEAVGRLAGGVAHDFNNVLSVILSYGDMLMGDMAPADPRREDLAEIVKAGQRAADLTRQLLMFSRRHVLAVRPLDLNEVVAGMDKMLRRILGEDVDLVTLPGDALGIVKADPGSIEQMIMNLAVNARDAMPTGGTLTIETGNVELDEAFAWAHVGVKAGPHVALVVSDTGTGMDRATQAHIFEPFFTTKGPGKGTGLGLSTVFGIVEQAGGSIWVYSEPGTGTSFKIYLPRAEGQSKVTGAPVAAAPPRGSETVLLVEDEPGVRAVALGILRRQGYEVLVARGPGDALHIAEAHPGEIHLLLTDVVMPEMGGPELARRVTEKRPDTRVLCMSGYTDDSIVRHGVLEYRVAYLQKPFSPATLGRKVREVLEAPR
ncbi:MAG: PAS domain S-box protein, partial [Polyangiaceae bacterium]